MATRKSAASKKATSNSADDKRVDTAKATSKSVTKKSTAKKAVAKKTAAKKAAPKKTASKKTASKPATKKTAVKKTTAAKATAKTASTHKKHHENAIATSSIAANVNTGIGISREYGRYALTSAVEIEIPDGYKPSEDEEYMSPLHLAYFREKLRDWREQLVEESRQTIDNLASEIRDVGDEAERATRETENSFELRTRDRYRKLLAKIDKSLRLIESGDYGYCEETDEEIGLARLEARPIATLSLDAQERREHLEKQMRD